MATTSTQTRSNKKRDKRFDDIVGPTDPKIDAQARERLIGARVALLLKHSFFGNLATRLQLVNADTWCGTAATDGLKFYYNSRFIMMLKPKEVEFLFGHEVLHVVYDHMTRRVDRDPQLFNIACDYAVNADLKRHKVGEFITTVPCLYDIKYDTRPKAGEAAWTAETIYDDLYKNAEKINIDDLIDQLIDDHMDDESEDQDHDGNRPKKMTPEERERLRQEVKQNIINAAKGADAGSVPGNVERMIRDITDPKMPWRELLAVNLVSAIKQDYTFSRPSRRGWHVDAIMPAQMPGEEVVIAVAIDMSGSISDTQAKAFLSEIQGIMNSFSAFNIHVFCFDTDVYNPQDFTSENLDSITEYVPAGGGGTDFDVIFTYLKGREMPVERLVVFTDGYPCGSWGDSEFCDTLWVIHGHPDPKPPFGEFALYDNK